MFKLALVLFTALCLAAHADEIDYDALSLSIHGDGIYTTSDQSKATNRLRSFEKDFSDGNMYRVAERGNYALRAIFGIAVKNLKRRGHYDTAWEVESGWAKLDGQLQRLVYSRNIADFEPWNIQLSVLYLLIETKLGYQLCYTLRITDIATYLWTPPVVFHPCKYGLTEFQYHFSEDSDDSSHKYRSFLPTTMYWVTTIGCSIGTFAAGIVFPICSPIAYLVELGAREYLAPKLGNFIFEKSCN